MNNRSMALAGRFRSAPVLGRCNTKSTLSFETSWRCIRAEIAAPEDGRTPGQCRRNLRLLQCLLLPVLVCSLVGCSAGHNGKQKDEFFTSGSREADQRASQRMAKEEQLAGSGEGAGDKDVKKAKANGNGSGEAAQAAGKLTLFDRLGGQQGIVAIVEEFTPRAMEDPRVNWQRKGSKRTSLLRRESADAWNPTPENVAQLKKHLVQFLSLASGGPPGYDGKNLKETHAGMRIGNPEFDAVIGDLKASLDKLQIPNKEQKELLAIIESTRPQIVTER